MVRKMISNVFFLLGLLLIIVFFTLPYLIMLMDSFKPWLELNLLISSGKEKLEPSFFPHEPTIANYARVILFYDAVLPAFMNSLYVSISTTLLTLFLGILAAYGLSRFTYKYLSVYKISLFFTHMVPGVSFLLPFFIIYMVGTKYLNIPLKESFIGLICLYTCFSLPFAILMLTKYFNSVPEDYDNQAMIDGCSRFSVLYRVIIPISMPGIYTIGIYSFLISWNEILFSSVLTNPGTRTISVALYEILDGSQKMAACVIITIPVIIIFSFFRKYCISGLASGGFN